MADANVILAIVQGISSLILVAITAWYVILTKRMLEMQIPPMLDVTLSGKEQHSKLDLANMSGCSVSGIHVEISVGFRQGEAPCPWGKCIFSKDWNRTFKHGDELVYEFANLLTPEEITELASHASTDGALVPSNLTLSYSFVRNADRRLFSYRRRVSFIDPMGYFSIDPPVEVATLKGLVAIPVRRRGDPERTDK